MFTVNFIEGTARAACAPSLDLRMYVTVVQLTGPLADLHCD
jgi:hypothetical protein